MSVAMPVELLGVALISTAALTKERRRYLQMLQSKHTEDMHTRNERHTMHHAATQ